MRSRLFRHKLLLSAVVLLLLALGVVAALPVWFPWVLKPFARKAGLTYGAYERNSDGRFTLRAVAFTNAQFELRAAQVRGSVPTAWWWHLRIARSNEAARLVVQDWDLTLNQRKAVSIDRKTGDRGAASSEPVSRQIDRTVARINHWLPHAAFTNGTLHSGGTIVHFPVLNWNNGSIAGVARYAEPAIAASFDIDLQARPYKLDLQSDALKLSLATRVLTNSSGLEIQTTGMWHSNKVELVAQLPHSGFIPLTATLRAPKVVVPYEVLKVPQYPRLEGAVEATWTNGQFDAHVSGSAAPVSTETNLSPLEFEFHVQGSTNEAVVRSAFVASSWLRVDLTHDAILLPRAPWLREPAQLAIKADLDQQGWVNLKGKVEANAFFSPALKEAPRVRFQLRGNDLARDTLRVNFLSMEGELDWPWLRVPSLEAEMEPGSTIALSGMVDLSRNLMRNGRFSITSEHRLPAMPREVEYAGLSVTGTFDGPLSNPVHHAEVQIKRMTLPGLKPARITLLSEGQGLQSSNFVFTLSPRDETELSMAGSFAFSNKMAELTLRELRLSSNGEPVLATARPAKVAFNPGKTNADWSVAVTGLALSGTAGSLDLEALVGWPKRGRMRAAIKGLSTSLVGDFLSRPLLPIKVNSMTADARWTNSPVTFEVTAALSGMSNFPFQAETRLRGDGEGLIVEHAALAEGETQLASLQGRLPLCILPGSQEIIHMEPAEPVEIHAFARPHGSLWSRLREVTGVDLVKPELAAEISGTWAVPQGRVEFKAERVVPLGSSPATPQIAAVDLVARADQARGWIERLDLTIQGQPVSLTAEIPLGKEFWRLTRDRKIPDWTQATGRLQMSNAPLAAFESLAPMVLAPEGDLSIDIVLRPGGNLAGEINLVGARTDSIGTLGPIRDLSLRLALEGRTARLAYGRAQIGGATVSLKGGADLDPSHMGPAGPPFKLVLHGKGVPLSRQTDSIFRGDLDLQLVGTNRAQPLLTGRVTFTNSYFLSDLGALAPSKVADPRRQPPYFSIEDKPLADWRLDVRVDGPRGFKVRSPLFNGEVSPNLRLTGTLRDPIAVGDVRIDSGSVRFPFGSLIVQQGTVTASPQDPKHPRLSITAAARQFGYDLRMDASGPINAPILRFSSVPPLTSDQVLLMLTAGQIPRGNVHLTPQQRAQTFAVFIGRDLLNKFGIEPGEERLVVRSGEEFSEEGRPTYDVEYKLSNRWSLTGEYDRFGDYNAGFKWRVYSK